MITDILNGTILFLAIGVLTIFCMSPSQPTTPELTFVDYSNCEKMVERPPQKTVWGDIGQGYDCLD